MLLLPSGCLPAPSALFLVACSFCARLDVLLAKHAASGEVFRVAVVGGGAGGVEVAFSILVGD